MLQLTNIRKSYTTGNFTQQALDDVSISFRDNEFVAILGPSGSGKTTMLNIIGGLDHYDSGDLIIEGISTKRFKDRDWDAYRNNRIGFVFQSYNLIPHQTVLANVELALTLSGVSREERRKRAIEALKRVGLGDHINKKPAQMSGGQMQRVAIARALINDPEILLADEPTGALDSKTSVQIMDLLTEIATDRLVVMVTHNPELAEEYATRTVNLADGTITSDSDPYIPTSEEIAAAHAKPTRRTRMSFLTALSLSANNLMTKKGRTLMTAIAGSIGIIGIAAILALANGVNNYIKTVEEDTLSVYPLQIMSTGFDVTSMFVGMSGDSSGGSEDAGGDDGNGGESGDGGDSSQAESTTANSNDDEGKLTESHMMSRMFASIGNNDLAALKSYFDSGESGIDEYANDIFYEYAVTPQIFDSNTENGTRQINPDTSFSSLGFSSTSTTNSIMSLSMSTDVFAEMPGDNSIIEDQYDIVAGHWPEQENELIMVLSQSGRISDFTSYVLGLRDPEELKRMVQQFANEEEVDVPETEIDVSYDDVMNMTFKLVNATNFYKRDDEYNVWIDKTDDSAYMKTLVDSGENLVISGILKPKPEANAVALNSGIYYTPELIEHIVDVAASSQIVQEQLDNPKIDVFSGKPFDEESDKKSEFDTSSLFSIDEDALANAFSFDSSALDLGTMDFSDIDFSSMDLSGMDLSDLDLSDMDFSDIDVSDLDLSNMDFSDIDLSSLGDMTNITMPQMTSEDIAKLFPELTNESIAQIASGLTIAYTDEQAFNDTVTKVISGYATWVFSNPTGTLNDYLATPDAQALLTTAIGYIDQDSFRSQLVAAVAKQLGTTSDGLGNEVSRRVGTYYASQIGDSLQKQISQQLSQQISTALQKSLKESQTTMIESLQKSLQKSIQSSLQKAIESYMKQASSALSQQISNQMTAYMSQLKDSLSSAMNVDTSVFANAFQFDMDPDELSELMTSMLYVEEHSYDNNLKKLGYADFAKPSEISIYPKDFESKEQIIRILDEYNDRMRDIDEDKVISYTDIVGTLMESVTTIINMISTVLIAFVAISLIVSSIMIGVITYISVLERKKEIGILRSIGASKGDISRVFNAETIIEGLIAGLLGVGVTALGCIPANIIVYDLFDVPNVALLPVNAAAILVAISVVLTFIAGLIPSGSASRKDPVEALRSE